MHRPVCRLKLALYSHRKAGYYWQEHCKAALRKCGWEQVPSWASMFCHQGKQLFLSASVYDFKMTGLANNLPQAWAELSKHLELEPPTEFHGGTYLGPMQYAVEIDPNLLEAQKERWESLYQDIRIGTYAASLGNLTAKDQKHKSENNKTEVDIVADKQEPNKGRKARAKASAKNKNQPETEKEETKTACPAPPRGLSRTA